MIVDVFENRSIDSLTSECDENAIDPIIVVVKCSFVCVCVDFWLGVCVHQLFLTQGFDEYMNLVLDDAEEVSTDNKRRSIGNIHIFTYISNVVV